MLSKLTHRVTPILTYHSFEPSSWKYSLEPALFDEHLDFLTSKGYVPLTLSEYAHKEGLALSTKPIILTFNGGFKNLEHILPILQKYHCKATFFISTAYVGQKSHWLSQPLTLLDWEALGSLDQLGMEIGSHGHEHLQLDVVPEVLARHDISYSKVLIEDKIGRSCTSFAYPYGYQNIPIKELVRSAGFSLACTMDDRVSTSESDLYSLPRLIVHGSMTSTNLKNLIRQKDSGVFTPYAMVKSSVSRQLRKWNTPLQEIHSTPVDLESKSSTPHTDDQPKVIQPKPTPKPIATSPQLSDTQLIVSHAPSSIYEPLQTTQPLRVEDEFLCPTEREQLGLQGEYLASYKAVLLAYPYYHLDEYKQLTNAVTLLQEAQENDLLFDNFEYIQQTYIDFELTVTSQIKDKTQQQKEDIQQQLRDLGQLPTALLHASAERVKNILEHHLATLQTHALNDIELRSAKGLIDNFKQRLHLSYRQELMRLLQKATNVNAQETLKDIQSAMRMLEQNQFPNLDTLEQSLKDKLNQDKYLKLNQRKTQKFNQDLEWLLTSFGNISALNNENVYSISSTIQYLKEQQPHFSKLSAPLQNELILSLKNAKKRLQSLFKESKTTTEVALNLLTNMTLDKAFSIFDTPQIDNSHVFMQDSTLGTDFKN